MSPVAAFDTHVVSGSDAPQPVDYRSCVDDAHLAPALLSDLCPEIAVPPPHGGAIIEWQKGWKGARAERDDRAALHEQAMSAADRSASASDRMVVLTELDPSWRGDVQPKQLTKRQKV